MTSDDAVRRWLDAYRTAWVDRDPDAAAALFADDALYREQPYEEPFRGPQGVREYWARVTAPQADVELTCSSRRTGAAGSCASTGTSRPGTTRHRRVGVPKLSPRG